MNSDNNFFDSKSTLNGTIIVPEDHDKLNLKTELEEIMKSFKDATRKIVSFGTFDRNNVNEIDEVSNSINSSGVSLCDSELINEFPVSLDDQAKDTSNLCLDDENNIVFYSPTSDRIRENSLVNATMIDTEPFRSDGIFIKVESPDVKLSELIQSNGDLAEVSELVQSNGDLAEVPDSTDFEVDNGTIADTFNNSEITISNTENNKRYGNYVIHYNKFILGLDITNGVTPTDDSTSPNVTNNEVSKKSDKQEKNANCDEKKLGDCASNPEGSGDVLYIEDVQLETNNNPEETNDTPIIITMGKGYIIRKRTAKDIKRILDAIEINEHSAAAPIQTKKRRTVQSADSVEELVTATRNTTIDTDTIPKLTAPSLNTDQSTPITSFSAVTSSTNSSRIIQDSKQLDLPTIPKPTTSSLNTNLSGPIISYYAAASSANSSRIIHNSKQLDLPTIRFKGYAARNSLKISHTLLISEGYNVDLFVNSFEKRLENLGSKFNYHWFALLEFCFEEVKSTTLSLYHWFKKKLHEGLSWPDAKNIMVCNIGYCSEMIRDAVKHEINFIFQNINESFESYFSRFCQVAGAIVSITKLNPCAYNISDSGLTRIFMNNMYHETKMTLILIDLWRLNNRFNPVSSICWKQFEVFVKKYMEYLVIRENVFWDKLKIENEKMEMEIKLVEQRKKEEAEKKRLEKEMNKKRLEEEKKRLQEEISRRLEERIREVEQKKQQRVTLQKTLKKQRRKEMRETARLEKQKKMEERRTETMRAIYRKTQGLCIYCGKVKHSSAHSYVCEERKNADENVVPVPKIGRTVTFHKRGRIVTIKHV